VIGSIALITAAIHFAPRPTRPGSFGPRLNAAGSPTPVRLGAESNRTAGLGLQSAAGASNLDAITAQRQKDDESTALARRANTLLASGDPKGAVRLLEEALRLTPAEETFHYNLGIAYSRSGDVTNAELHYREALRLLPDYPEVHNNLGNLLLHAGRLSEAEAQFTEAIRLMPELASAHNNLGLVRRNQNRMPEAIACFRKAVQYNTNYWQAHYNLALASLSQGATNEGRRELQTVLRLNPGYGPAQSTLDRLPAQPSGQ